MQAQIETWCRGPLIRSRDDLLGDHPDSAARMTAMALAGPCPDRRWEDAEPYRPGEANVRR